MNSDDIITKLEERVDDLEKRMAQKDTEFAVINTKLSAILWGVGVTGTALIGPTNICHQFLFKLYQLKLMWNGISLHFIIAISVVIY